MYHMLFLQIHVRYSQCNSYQLFCIRIVVANAQVTFCVMCMQVRFPPGADVSA